MLTAVEVNRRDAAVRGLDQRQTSRADDVHVVVSRKLRVRLRVIYPMQLHSGDGHVRRHIQHARARIRRTPRPVSSAPLAWNRQDALLRRRRVQRAVVVLGENGLGFFAQLRRKVNQVVLADTLAL